MRATVQYRRHLFRRSSRVTGFPSTRLRRKATLQLGGSASECEAQRRRQHRPQRNRRLATILFRGGPPATVPEKMPIAVHSPSVETSKRCVTLRNRQRAILRAQRRDLDFLVHHGAV